MGRRPVPRPKPPAHAYFSSAFHFHGISEADALTVSSEPPIADAHAPGPLLVLEQVEQRYEDFRPVLVGVDLSVSRGEFVVIGGPGASGKSVLLRLLSGLERPAGGRVRIAGEDLARMRPRARAHLRRSIGILPPDDLLLDRRSVLENVAMAAWVAGTAREEGVRRAQAALALVGVDVGRYAASPCGRLAGGQRRSVALARALVNRPALLLLDDLLTMFDEAGAARVLQVIDQFCAAGVTAIAASRTPADAGAGAPDGAAAPSQVPVWPARARRLWLRDGRLAA